MAMALFVGSAFAQVPPGESERLAYRGLFDAAARGDAARIRALLAGGEKPDARRDGHGRTPLHVAAHMSKLEAMRALVEGGADPNALEADRYDIITIAAVANDLPTLRTAIQLGGSARNITSRYDGTALIAAAHLGHEAVVRVLISANAPLDHVNNLGWTALIEAIILGRGGPEHQEIVRMLLAYGANPNLPDGQGRMPLRLARDRGYGEIVAMLEAAGGRETR